MNVHDRATRQQAADRNVTTTPPDPADVVAQLRAQAAATGNPKVIEAVEQAIAKEYPDQRGTA